MINTLTVEDCTKMIQSAKVHGKRYTKVKISQSEIIHQEGKKDVMKVYLKTLGTLKCMEVLKSQGYDCKMEKTDKQVTVGYDLKGTINKCNVRDLFTTNLVIRW